MAQDPMVALQHLCPAQTIPSLHSQPSPVPIPKAKCHLPLGAKDQKTSQYSMSLCHGLFLGSVE